MVSLLSHCRSDICVLAAISEFEISEKLRHFLSVCGGEAGGRTSVFKRASTTDDAANDCSAVWRKPSDSTHPGTQCDSNSRDRTASKVPPPLQKGSPHRETRRTINKDNTTTKKKNYKKNEKKRTFRRVFPPVQEKWTPAIVLERSGQLLPTGEKQKKVRVRIRRNQTRARTQTCSFVEEVLHGRKWHHLVSPQNTIKKTVSHQQHSREVSVCCPRVRFLVNRQYFARGQAA